MASNVPTWLSQYTLATETISRHNTPASIFDDAELARLQAFCADPSRKDSLLREWAGAGAEIGNGRGSLVGHCVQRHGTEEWVFSQGDIEMLREWFDGGVRA